MYSLTQLSDTYLMEKKQSKERRSDVKNCRLVVVVVVVELTSISQSEELIRCKLGIEK